MYSTDTDLTLLPLTRCVTLTFGVLTFNGVACHVMNPCIYFCQNGIFQILNCHLPFLYKMTQMTKSVLSFLTVSLSYQYLQDYRNSVQAQWFLSDIQRLTTKLSCHFTWVWVNTMSALSSLLAQSWTPASISEWPINYPFSTYSIWSTWQYQLWSKGTQQLRHAPCHIEDTVRMEYFKSSTVICLFSIKWHKWQNLYCHFYL